MRQAVRMGSSLRWIVVLLALSSPSLADGLRCGSKLVTDGDTIDQVRALCGAPVNIERRDILQQPSIVRDGRVIFLGDEAVLVPVELWTYNFGPNKLMRRLRFVDGRLEQIETLGYGYRDADEL